MRVLQINSVCDKGSTGRTTRELADVLQSEGHECYVAYGYRTSTYKNSFKIASYPENLFHNAFFTRMLGLHGFGTIHGTKKLVRWIEKNRPDIIHLRNLHANYLNYPILFRCIIKHNIPVVFTLHDCFNFTGKCSHYTTQGCYKWKTECHHCPQYRTTIVNSMFFDFSRFLFRDKKKYYSRMKNMTVVAVSKWLKHEAEQSMLAVNGHTVTYVYNWVDYSKFHRATEQEIAEFKQKYHLESNKKYLISVSDGWFEGAPRYEDAKKLAEILPSEYQLVIVGNKSARTLVPPSIIHIPYINGSQELSAAYSMAQAYIHFSVEDTFGKVIAEAMSCGTVPITFDSTACGEVPGPYGVVVKPHDIEAIVQALPRLEELQEKRDEMVQYVHENYDPQINAHKYIELYKELLANKK